MADLQQLREVAAQLRELQRTSPTNGSEIRAWDASARRFSETLRIPLPSQAMHYLHDADVRIKEPEYGEFQDEMLSRIISELESGILPASTTTTLSFHPRWLGAIALCVVAVICWFVFW